MAEKMTDCDRYAPAIGAFFLGLMFMALDFGAVVLSGGSPITPEVYGHAVYAIPAVSWVGIQITFCVLGMLGVLASGCLRSWLFIIGGSGCLLLFSMFAIMALGAPQGSVLAAGSRSFVCPLLVLIIISGASGCNARK